MFLRLPPTALRLRSVQAYRLHCFFTAVLLLALVGNANAVSNDAPHLNGGDLGIVWTLPFIGILVSIALLPLITPHFWHQHYGKVAAFWALAFLLPFAGLFGFELALYELLHTLLLEYMPFIILLFALFTVAGGIWLKGNLHGTPALNTGMLGIGTLIASWTGTTGAAMLLIRPVIRANDNRRYNVHVIIFFIFLVANIGGSLTPLGDPPLFLGFLKGVDFFWPTIHMLAPMTLVAGVLLVIFYFLDRYYYRKEGVLPPDPTPDRRLGIEGKINILFLAGIVGAVLLSGVWKSGISVSVYRVNVELQNLLRDALLIILACVSLKLTPDQCHHANGFTWEPIKEVAKLFAGIFLTIIPAIAILRAGTSGALAPVVNLVTDSDGQPVNTMYFWATGILSSFLDNAPTYLIFFNTAGGDAQALMGPLANTLLAISAGAVFMGANTYIGNAPNFMVKTIAEHQHIKMPSFVGYMAWACIFLLPLFVLTSWLFFA